jgi:hypothetical protein
MVVETTITKTTTKTLVIVEAIVVAIAIEIATREAPTTIEAIGTNYKFNFYSTLQR